MEFNTFKEFIEQVNNDLRQVKDESGIDFCRKFAEERKRLKKAINLVSPDKLFHCKGYNPWAKNKGGTFEVQYHTGFDKSKNIICYGIGFNSRGRPNKGEPAPIDCVMPYVRAFLSDTDTVKLLVEKMGQQGFKYMENNHDHGYISCTKIALQNMEREQYYLFGKQIDIENNEISDEAYDKMIKDLKGILFELYIKVFEEKNRAEQLDDKSQEKNKIEPLGDKMQEIKDLLENNYNLVLTGAPGTGKTYLARKFVQKMIENQSGFKEQQMGFVQFHPTYDYTDFVEGIRPTKEGDFKRMDGIFKAFCKKAIEDEKNKYYFIIDEINRGDLNKILGELFYSIDMYYRGEENKVQTQYQNLVEDNDTFKDGFYIPKNLYIIGTMNDIDRSVDSIDFAIRRRFAWKEIKAEDTRNDIIETLCLDDELKKEIKKKMKSLNKEIIGEELGSMYEIGAAYFMKIASSKDFNILWENHIKCVLEEYLRGDKNKDSIMRKFKDAYDNPKDDE